jgi:hypothetical protein
MNHCDTCKYWNREDPEGMGACNGQIKKNAKGTPDLDIAAAIEWPSGEPDKMVFVALVTGPKFGCVRWEAKP